jgi:NADPH:quinone reductase-like Zn-dependent oxidoreductase
MVYSSKSYKKPTPKDNEVLVKIHATTVTSGDVMLRSLAFPFRILFRLVLGVGRSKMLLAEPAGEKESAGKDVEPLQNADQGFSSIGQRGGLCRVRLSA